MAPESSPPIGSIELARRRRGWKQADLAEAASVSRSAISAIERGYRPAEHVRERISRALGEPPWALWPDDETVARELARALSRLWERLLDELGEQFFEGAGAVGFEATATGRPAISVAGTTYFEAEDGRLVASRVEGGRAVFATIGEDGSLNWSAAPLADPAMN